MKKNYLLLILFIFSSCAHYFKKNDEASFVKKEILRNPICISMGEGGAIRNNEKLFYLDEGHKTHGKIITRIKEKYPSLQYDCNSDKKVIIKYHKVQEKTSSDFLILSLGIIPEIINVEYFLSVCSPDGNAIYNSSSSGKIVLSIFLVPVFFLNKWEEEIIFDEIDKYLKDVAQN